MDYNFEHLIPGTIGKVSILLACIFVLASALTAIIYNSQKNKNAHLFSFSRNLYVAHFALILTACIALYYIILNHYFEYNYVWRHSSLNTPIEYIISCFWAGQEGSFLLWILIQAFIGLFLIRKKNKHTATVLAVFALVQFLLLLNIIGMRIGGIQIGTGPFFLLREISDDPLFNNPDYLQFLADGNGLNPLLLNPWMVSHPPLIFIGYALALAPFALVISGLVSRAYNDIIRPTIFWMSAAIFFLGLGIIVGGAWAYESLTFGGFWAWDPVENASLVPWIIMLGALHLLLMVKKRGKYLLPAFLFTLAAFWFVIYAAFLTRSGIMSETSVHSFSKESFYTYQLIALLFTAFVVPLILVILRRKDLTGKDDSPFLSREYLIYVGTIFLMLSAFQIIFSTSIPVINKLFGTNLAPPLHREAFYNTWQLPFAVIFCFLIAFTQFLSFGQNNTKALLKRMALPLFISVFATLATALYLSITQISFTILLFASFLCLTFSLDALLRFFKSTPNKTASITHLGFGIFMLGVLLTFAHKEILSKNIQKSGHSDSIMLMKDVVQDVDTYKIRYNRHVKANNRLYFLVDFFEKNPKNNTIGRFTLSPHIIINENMGNVYEPAIRKYLTKDIFMYITYVDIESILSGKDYTLKESINISLKDTIHFSNTYLYFDTIYVGGNADTDFIKELIITAQIIVYNPFGDNYIFKPSYIIKNNRLSHKDAINKEMGIKIKLKDLLPQPNTIQIEIYEEVSDFIVVKIVKFPYINLMWLGVFIMFFGLIISFIKNVTKQKKNL